MSQKPPSPSAVVVWDETGSPRSAQFGDIYFSREDGLAETRAVFLQGCGLSDAWRGRRRFTVGELGFGTGLNIAALLDLWRREGPAGARLHIFSVEAYPLTRQEAARALSAWPQIGEAAHALLDAWPAATAGFQRIDLPAFRASLDLAVMDVLPALQAWRGRADAWFLDGFSPAANPQMWRSEVLAEVAARSAPGARLATFTVAGQVRRDLHTLGFSVEKRAGFGRKRERLEARAPGEAAEHAAPTRIAIIGAGIAGAALARSLRDQGLEPLVIDAGGAGAGASGNPAALVTPGLDASGGHSARFYAQAHARAVALYRSTAADSIIATGVVRLAADERDERRFAKAAAQPWFDRASMAVWDDEEITAVTGEPSPAGLHLADSLVVEPRRVLEPWLGEQPRIGEVAALEPQDESWRIRLSDGGSLSAQAVVVAAGWGSARLLPQLRLSPVRGQASFLACEDRPYPSVYGDYLIPTREGLLFGATHDRGETALAVTQEATARNLATLAVLRPGMAGRIDPAALQGRTAVRAATPDRLPLSGALERPGLFVLAGLGSRGFTTAPLLAEDVCAIMLGAAPPLPADLQARVSPARHGPEPG